MKRLLTALLLSSAFILCAQKPDGKKELEEGLLLYRLEKAAWNTSDDIRSSYNSLLDGADGYLSYENADTVFTIFYMNDPENTVIARYAYNNKYLNSFSKREIGVPSTQQEKELIKIRKNALTQLVENEDGFFLFYENTSPNLIPIIDKNGRRVYILTAPSASGIVLLGNDYLLTYDGNNDFIEKKKLHNTLISLGTEVDGNHDAFSCHIRHYRSHRYMYAASIQGFFKVGNAYRVGTGIRVAV